MGKKPIARRTVRVAEDAVTHQIVTTVLDDVQLAWERIVQTIDRERLRLNDDAKCYRLVDRVRAALDEMVPHTDG